MRFSSRDETCDTNTPSSSSSRTSINGGIRRKSSNETIQSYQGSISNSSVHTISTAESSDTHRDLSDLSGQCFPPAVSRHSSEPSTGQYPSVLDHKSLHSLEKPTSLLRNQSLSTICTTDEPNSDCESDSGSTSPPTPKQEPSPSSLPALEDEAEMSLPPTPRSPQAIVPTEHTWAKALSPSTGSSSSPVFAAPPPLNDRLMKSYGKSPTTEISTADTPSIRPTPFFPPPTDRIGTRSRARSISTFKEKKGILSFMNGLRKSVDFRDSNKRLEVSAPYDPVHVQHAGFDSITGKLTILPGKRQEFLQDNHISKHDQEKDSLATIEFSHGNDLNTMRYDVLKVPRPPPHTPGMAPTVNPEVSKPVDDGLTSTGLRVLRFPRPLSDSSSLPLPKTGHARAHSSSGSQVLSTTYSPASHRPFPPLPTRPEALPKPPYNDTPVRGNATGDRSPGPQASVKATATTTPITERLAQPATAPQQQSAVAASLAKSAGASPRRREKKKQSKADDADLMKRLQGICKDADPTRLYRNLAKIGQG
jgi:p21-activated kinase 1